MKKPRTPERILSAKRHRKWLRRRMREERRRDAKSQRVPYKSAIVDSLRDSIPGTRESGYRRATITIPKVFSFISNPQGALEAIGSLVASGRAESTRLLHFDHRELMNYDLAAEEVLDLVAMELRKEHASRGYRVPLEGRYPDNLEAARFLRAIGIIKNLRVQSEYLGDGEAAELVVFELKRGRRFARESIGSADQKARIVREFADFVNSCLGRNGRELTKAALGRLCSYTGEVIANAEDHSGSNEWFVAGYLDNAVAPHICEIAVFSFGKSFADTFLELDAASYPRSQVDEYVAIHSSKGFFSARYKREDLYTLIALQGGVSSKNAGPTDTRGQGTIDLIAFFERICAECTQTSATKAEMAILSGATHVHFDGTYRLGTDAGGRRVIAFNKSNQLSDSPDQQYIRNLGAFRFPGTIISIRFPMQPSQTVEVEA